MKKTFFHNHKGYTLIELMGYFAISTVAILVLTTFAVDVAKSAAATKAEQEVQHNARFLMTKIMQDVRNAQAILSVTADEMSLRNKAGVTIGYRLLNSAVEYNDGGGYEQISSDKVEITELQFSSPTDPDQVFIELAVEQKDALAGYPLSTIQLQSSAFRRISIY